jgi:hypothetical protein
LIGHRLTAIYQNKDKSHISEALETVKLGMYADEGHRNLLFVLIADRQGVESRLFADVFICIRESPMDLFL